MDFVQVLVIFLALKVFQVICIRHLALKDIYACDSVIYLSYHGVVNDSIIQSFMQHATSSIDVFYAHQGKKGPLTDTERVRYENERVHLLAQWKLLFDEIQSAYKQDLEALQILRPRDQVVVADNHGCWSQLLDELQETCESLRKISLTSTDAVPTPSH